MFRTAPCAFLIALLAATGLHADSKKSKEDQRVELLRGLTAEYATVKSFLPRSKKPLDFDASNGTWDKDKWEQAGRELGPAGRIGDLIQVTHVGIDKDAIILELNNGTKGKGHWYDRVQVSGGLGGVSQSNPNAPTEAPGGTTIAVHYPGGIGDLTSADVKKILTPVLDFEKHSVTEQYIDTLPPEIKQAVTEKRAMEGMDRDQVLLAMGRPVRKTRESHEGVETEDWIYGEPPGKMTFVTFTGPKVSKVKETYAGLGGSIAESPKQP